MDEEGAVVVCSLAGVMLDDIVVQAGDERRHLGRRVPGGSGLHAVCGMCLARTVAPAGAAEARLALVGAVGADFDLGTPYLRGVDLSAVRVVPALPTPHAAQVYDAAGRREHRWLTPFSDFRDHFRNTAQHLPNPARPHVFHTDTTPQSLPGILQAMPLPSQEEEGKRARCRVVWEPVPPAFAPASLPQFAATLPAVDVFCPSLDEARRLLSEALQPAQLGSAGAVAAKLLALSQRAVVLRMGSEGCLAARQEDCTTQGNGERTVVLTHLPAFPVAKAIDPTGAGNAFCGALLVCLNDKDLGWLEAVATAAAVASVCVESVGPVPVHARPVSEWATTVRARREWVLEHAKADTVVL